MCIMSFHCTDMLYPFTLYNFQSLSGCSYASFPTVLVPFSVYCLVIFNYDYYVRSYCVRVCGVWVIIVDIYQVVDVYLALLIFSLTTFITIVFDSI
jgi:hypothetical protein